MQNKTKKIELLAPAKNKEIAFTAIDSGADAVYMGFEKFGARSAAGNSIDDIKTVIEYAHTFGVKVYITLNTIFTDEEITQVEKTIQNLYEIKADGIIIQDMGILELNLPPIPIIASTQCHNNTLEKIKFLEETGFKRVITPREFSLEEIKNITENTNIEVETFIHGALCVSYSGQCYLSQAIGGRSANKGQCAQPCRKKYSLVDDKNNYIEKNKYLLSLKDFNLSEHLKELILAGVTSFKIEGRLKDEQYIKNIVSFYRKELDKVLTELNLSKSSYGHSIINFEPNPSKTFNRGYTNYFLKGRSKDISATNYSKSLGEYIGKIKSITDKSFCLDSGTLNNGDGICFFNQKNELIGTKINKSENNIITPNSMKEIKVNTKIYRNYDNKFETQDLKTKTVRKINTTIEIASKNNSIGFKITDENNISTQINIQNDFEKAKETEKAIQTIQKQLAKLGNSEFAATEIYIKLDEIPFIPVAQLNNIKRELVEKLQFERKNAYIQEKRTTEIKTITYPKTTLTYESNVSNKKAKTFYLKRGVKNIEPAAETQKSLSGKRVMTTKHCLKYMFNMCLNNSKNKKPIELYLLDEYNKKYKLDFDCKNCEMHIYF